MQHKGIRYSVVQTVGAAFRWTVCLKAGERVGEARNRTYVEGHKLKDS